MSGDIGALLTDARALIVYEPYMLIRAICVSMRYQPNTISEEKKKMKRNAKEKCIK